MTVSHQAKRPKKLRNHAKITSSRVGGFGAGNGTDLQDVFEGAEVCPPFAAITVVLARQHRDDPAAGSGSTTVVAVPVTTCEPLTVPNVVPFDHSTVVEAMSATAKAEPSE